MSGETRDPPIVRGPLIPEAYIDFPSQRLYYLSLGLVCQAIKILDFLQYLLTPTNASTKYGRKWLMIDFIYCALLARLRIPRLNYTKSIVLLHIFALWFLDGLLFGGIQLNLASGLIESSSMMRFSNRPNLPSTPSPFYLADILSPLGLGFLASPRGSTGKDAHLLGQHTVRMSPISTAQLNPDQLTFCLGEPGSNVLVPVLLNNTDVSVIRFSLTPLGYKQIRGEDDKSNKAVGKVEYHDLPKRELRVIQQAHDENVRQARPYPTQEGSEDFDEYDDEDEVDQKHTVESSLQKTQSLQYIRLSKPGILRLERIVDVSNIEARIFYPMEVTVVPCPKVEFSEEKVDSFRDIRCHGHDKELDLTINIQGVPPLTLKWFKEINARREHFLVEGIEGGHEDRHSLEEGDKDWDVGRRTRNVPQDLKVPLSVSLDTIGTHLYVLEEIIDGVGNILRVAPASLDLTTPNNSKIARSLTVLRRPSFSFLGCGPGNPTPLLIGSEAPLTVATNAADVLDAPWEVLMKYVPPSPGDESSKAATKRFKPWKRTIKTPGIRKDLVLRANAPGEYTILGVKGKWCEGDVLAPETCKVFERPIPTAAIEWKRIHECSGDTGVSASLIFHGTAPFTVHYQTQRNKDSPKELAKIFPTSRGELTLQPPHSGHYKYTITHLSDAYYSSVPLHGPSIDQIVHPLAAVAFSNAMGPGTKKMINSCSGNFIGAEVELDGNGPWNLEVQVVGPKSSEILQFPGISESKRTLQIPIPTEIDKDGGSFEVMLATVEDANGCKRPITQPGIFVNVRRVKSTARFYGNEDKRRTTILAGERAYLPLRLTGDGPWRIVYKYISDDGDFTTLMATASSPNGHLEVKEPGIYEIISVLDSQCPGSVIPGGATYKVDWIPRPSARLSPRSGAVYTRVNRSHILPPICEGTDDQVDLELTGRPPFEITYNIAKSDGAGEAEQLDQFTFNSIQPRTRFQLQTSAHGRMYYEVKLIGDAAYPLRTHSAVLALSDRLLFEQQVLRRPTAHFRSSTRLSYCLHDTLTPRGLSAIDAVVLFFGTPPFILELSVKSLASSEVQVKAIEVFDRIWKLDLPSYKFTSMGPHLIRIQSVTDASHCEQAPAEPLAQSLWIDVAETATIVPFDRREDFCVGDVPQFQLEGIPPWTIGYRINGKSYVQEARASPFSLLQQQPGEFTITSIAHQQRMCKTAVTDLRFTVHDLPAAQVGHGKRIYQDIHEGDQAEIVFTLVGEPPFTFTYHRSESPSQPGGRPGKVLETHTVSGVTSKEYSIYSALEGTWTVASIADRYCRYPPAQSSGQIDKSR